MSGAFRKPLRQTLSDIVLLILALAILLANAAQAAPDYFANNYPSLRELLKDAAGADAAATAPLARRCAIRGIEVIEGHHTV